MRTEQANGTFSRGARVKCRCRANFIMHDAYTIRKPCHEATAAQAEITGCQSQFCLFPLCQTIMSGY
ncbi:hypothetical protein AA21952_0612 [Acetobacter oeni LMG 21952]|nr:hypothetical protein AA21952_0612 [Acetobacter oeni LMG 21952]